MDQRIPREAVWEALLYAAAPYAGKKELEEYYTADPTVIMPEKASRRMAGRIRRERRYIENHEKYRPALIIISRTLVIILTVFAVVMAAFLPSEKVRDAMWETFLEWGEESILVSFVGTDATDAPTEILEYREPREIGEEYERVVKNQTPCSYLIEYYLQEYQIIYEQRVISKVGLYVSNEDTKETVIHVGQYEGILTEFMVGVEKYFCVTYTDGDYAYTIYSNTSIKNLIAFAESIT